MASTRDELLTLHKDLTAEALQLIEAKNKDYGSDRDILKNFRRHGRMGICVRLDDKLCRLESFAEKGVLVNESVRDTVVDIINYAVLYLAFEDRKP